MHQKICCPREKPTDISCIRKFYINERYDIVHRTFLASATASSAFATSWLLINPWQKLQSSEYLSTFSRYRQTNDDQDEIVTVERYDMDTVPSIPDAESFVSSCWRDGFLPRPGSSLFLVVVFPISLPIYRCSSVNAVDSWFELLRKLAGRYFPCLSKYQISFLWHTSIFDWSAGLLSFFMSRDSSSQWRLFIFSFF